MHAPPCTKRPAQYLLIKSSRYECFVVWTCRLIPTVAEMQVWQETAVTFRLRTFTQKSQYVDIVIHDFFNIFNDIFKVIKAFPRRSLSSPQTICFQIFCIKIPMFSQWEILIAVSGYQYFLVTTATYVSFDGQETSPIMILTQGGIGGQGSLSIWVGHSLDLNGGPHPLKPS